MEYIKVTLLNPGQEISDILIALMTDAGFEGFEETPDSLNAFIPADQFDVEALIGLIALFNLGYKSEVIQSQNWNALWESSFQPICIDDYCTIRAHFHAIEVTTPYDIIVTPKMSFGTGHHATTQLMILMMRNLDFKGATVLDFGTGTGVLAILAAMLGAEKITAIDNDEWPVANAKENIVSNNVSGIEVLQGSLEDIPVESYDIILANINRHILLHYMADMFHRLKAGGQILMSGLLLEDKEIIQASAEARGFHLLDINERMNWIALRFSKPS